MFRVFFIVVGAVAVTADVNFEIKNVEGGPVWVGIQGNPGHPHLANGGFVLKQGESRTVQSPDQWQGRFWGRTWCDEGSKHCATGDCGNKIECGGAGGEPPATLAEFTIKGTNGLDTYDVSLVDGFNIPVTIEQEGGKGDNSKYSCTKASCTSHINDKCPAELQLKNGDTVVACKSACLAFKTDEYCCTGEHGTSETCPKPAQYADFFKNECPDAYSYAFNDNQSTFTCLSNKYIITFGA